MRKDNLMHSHLKVRSACKRLNCAIEDNPDFFRGLKIPANEVVRRERYALRNISIAGILLAFFVRAFH